MNGYRFTASCPRCGGTLLPGEPEPSTPHRAGASTRCDRCMSLWRIDVKVSLLEEWPVDLIDPDARLSRGRVAAAESLNPLEGMKPMTEYPKIEVRRDVYGSGFPHELRIRGAYVDDLTDAEADQWEALAKFAEPLPDGVRWAMVVKGSEIPDGWEASLDGMEWLRSDRCCLSDWIYEVRPPQEPATERIWGPNACGRKTPEGHPITVVMRHGESPHFDTTVIDMDGVVEADPDGRVDVLVEQAQ